MTRGRTVFNRKMRVFRRYIAAAATLSTIGCTTWKNVDMVEIAVPADRPQKIHVLSRGGQYVVFKAIVKGDSLHGWSDERRTKPVTFAVADIQQARVSQFSSGRTALAVLGGVAAALGIWLMLIASAGGITYGM